MTTSSVRVRSLTTADAAQVSCWRYQDRWSVYDLSSSDILNELGLYRAVIDGDDILIGFLCVGAAARVRGLDPDPQMLDVGVGMDPRLVGQGSGRAFGTVVLDHLSRRYPGRPLRAVIQSWNVRSRQFAASLGFVDVGDLSSTRGEQQSSYRVLLKADAESSRGLVVARCGTWLFGDRLMLREFVPADVLNCRREVFDRHCAERGFAEPHLMNTATFTGSPAYSIPTYSRASSAVTPSYRRLTGDTLRIWTQ